MGVIIRMNVGKALVSLRKLIEELEYHYKRNGNSECQQTRGESETLRLPPSTFETLIGLQSKQHLP